MNYWHQLLLILLAIEAIHGYTISMDKADIKVAPNPYFDQWSASIASSKDAMTLKAPIKTDLPPDIKVRMEITMGDDQVPDQLMTLCQAFKDENLQEFFELGKPLGKFPTECPVQPGKDFVIENYVFPSEKIPDGTPAGPIVAKMSVFEEGQDPYIVAVFEGNINE